MIAKRQLNITILMFLIIGLCCSCSDIGIVSESIYKKYPPLTANIKIRFFKNRSELEKKYEYVYLGEVLVKGRKAKARKTIASEKARFLGGNVVIAKGKSIDSRVYKSYGYNDKGEYKKTETIINIPSQYYGIYRIINSKSKGKIIKKPGLILEYRGGRLYRKSPIKNAKKHGEEEIYDFVTGQLTTKNYYKNGSKTMVHEYWLSGTIKSISPYQNGNKKGLYKSYYQEGSLYQSVAYKNGKKQGIAKSYHKNGQVWCQVDYRNDVPEGSKKCYHDNGQLQSIISYKNGQVNGVSKRYYENGQLKSMSYYKNGKMHGLHREYLKNGQLLKKEYYKNGTLIKK